MSQSVLSQLDYSIFKRMKSKEQINKIALLFTNS